MTASGSKTVKAAAFGNHVEGYVGVLIEVSEKVVRECGHRHRDTVEARECVRYNDLAATPATIPTTRRRPRPIVSGE